MAGANRLNWPRRGSMQIWPRVRSKRVLPRIRNWAETSQKMNGFIGYKVGMTHVMFFDKNQNSPTKNQNIFMPTTIVECPPLTPSSLRFYKKTVHGYKMVADCKKGSKIPDDFDRVNLVVNSNPKVISTGQKSPEVLEIRLNLPKDEIKSRFSELLEKQITVKDIFKEGQMVDIHAVTKGKGFQGTVKRFGVKIRRHKSEKVKRGTGTLGPWTPSKVLFSVSQPGKMGYHARVDYNKQIMKISNKPEEINPKGGFLRYGDIKTDYVVLKGTIPGPAKRAVVLTEPIRPSKPQPGEITQINLDSRQ